MLFYDWNKISERSTTDGYSRGVAAGGAIMMAHIELEAGAVTASHSHGYEEIIYVVKGKWKVSLDDEEFILGANQTLVVRPGVKHSSTALEDTTAIVSTNFRPEWHDNSDYWLHYNPENHLWAV